THLSSYGWWKSFSYGKIQIKICIAFAIESIRKSRQLSLKEDTDNETLTDKNKFKNRKIHAKMHSNNPNAALRFYAWRSSRWQQPSLPKPSHSKQFCLISTSGPFYRTEQPVRSLTECVYRCEADCQAVLFHLDACHLLRFPILPHELKDVAGMFTTRV
ncbi:hypothetical protein BOX15_Mlig021839g1, partial [Macrostomum lignano]